MFNCKYSVLFDILKVGAVTIRVRFFWFPNLSGIEYSSLQYNPKTETIMVNGYWAIVCNEKTVKDSKSQIALSQKAPLWSVRDTATFQMITKDFNFLGALC